MVAGYTDTLSAKATGIQFSLARAGCGRGVNVFLTMRLPNGDQFQRASGNMRHESKFSARIRSGGHSTFILSLHGLAAPETKFSVQPDRLLDSIIDDALALAVARLNRYLPGDVAVDLTAVDLTPIRDQLRGEVAVRLTEIGVAVNPNDPVMTAIIARYAEILNGFF